MGEELKLPALARCGTYAGLGRGGVAAALLLLLLLAPVGVAAAVGTCERRRSTPLSLPPKTRARGGRTDGREDRIFSTVHPMSPSGHDTVSCIFGVRVPDAECSPAGKLSTHPEGGAGCVTVRVKCCLSA